MAAIITQEQYSSLLVHLRRSSIENLSEIAENHDITLSAVLSIFSQLQQNQVRTTHNNLKEQIQLYIDRWNRGMFKNILSIFG